MASPAKSAELCPTREEPQGHRASGQRPAASGQRPAASGQRPAASGQRPAASGSLNHKDAKCTKGFKPPATSAGAPSMRASLAVSPGVRSRRQPLRVAPPAAGG
ncbi:hypothetical protein EBL85_09400 [Marichromatium sp. AB32]|nr:hypothetical protein EBL85_09400 [Marichromatium sp. AB32]